jgi:hypothetical protein
MYSTNWGKYENDFINEFNGTGYDGDGFVKMQG